MSKIVKKKISWSPSTAADVVGYKLYWSENTNPDYDSQFIQTTDTNVVIPDGITNLPPNIDGNIVFGVSAIDDVGNESDLAFSGAIPLDFTPPEAPSGLSVESV